jgi:hypothetical protein
MNQLFMQQEHGHLYTVRGYAPATDPASVERALRRDLNSWAVPKTLNSVLNELRSGQKTSISFRAMTEALKSDGFDPDNFLHLHGEFIKFQDHAWNLVVNTGLDDILDKYYKGSTYTAAHYCGLTDGTPSFAAGDTMASHAGWAEVTAYDEAVRQTLTWGAVSGQSVDNSASKAVFTIDTNNTTIGGGFATTNSTKGGSTGTLVGGAAFTAGDKTLDDNDTLSVQVTATAAAS